MWGGKTLKGHTGVDAQRGAVIKQPLETKINLKDNKITFYKQTNMYVLIMHSNGLQQ